MAKKTTLFMPPRLIKSGSGFEPNYHFQNSDGYVYENCLIASFQFTKIGADPLFG
jgi:hypothetical protein